MSALYDDILKITREYMGIVAESFVRRRCQNSLGLDDPRNIEPKDLEAFSSGVAQTGEVYMDAEKVREFVTAIVKLKGKYQ